MDNAIILTIEEPNKKEPNKKEPNKKEEEDILLDEAEKDIENEIQNLQEQLALSREIKRKKELYKEAQNKKIEALREEMTAKTLQYNMEMADISKQIEDLENNKTFDMNKILDTIDEFHITKNLVTNVKKPRLVVKRRPLHEVIKQPTKFRAIIKGIEFFCYTEDGHKIVGYNENDKIKTFSSLNEWVEHSIASVCSENATTTKKSVYEVVSYYNNAKKEWRQLKMDYNGDTLTLN
jgi:vacuolar-type H+-ATPase subunit I/STV1